MSETALDKPESAKETLGFARLRPSAAGHHLGGDRTGREAAHPIAVRTFRGRPKPDARGAEPACRARGWSRRAIIVASRSRRWTRKTSSTSPVRAAGSTSLRSASPSVMAMPPGKSGSCFPFIGCRAHRASKLARSRSAARMGNRSSQFSQQPDFASGSQTACPVLRASVRFLRALSPCRP